jgi:hypothetical protein
MNEPQINDLDTNIQFLVDADQLGFRKSVTAMV